MRPISDIKIGDVYQNRITGTEFVVINKNNKEKMVEMLVNSVTLPESLNKPFWRRNTDKIFNNRVMEGYLQ